uniref:Uncharacterized protein n=1 Tax=Arundo donax TaxID=35708 RepID=A0A0A8ZA89_ARUDO
MVAVRRLLRKDRRQWDAARGRVEMGARGKSSGRPMGGLRAGSYGAPHRMASREVRDGHGVDSGIPYRAAWTNPAEGGQIQHGEVDPPRDPVSSVSSSRCKPPSLRSDLLRFGESLGHG